MAFGTFPRRFLWYVGMAMEDDHFTKDHGLAESPTNEAERFRRLAEDAREFREQQREAAETMRQDQDRLRDVAETARSAAEAGRVAAAVSRQTELIAVHATAEALQVTLEHLKMVEQLRRALREHTGCKWARPELTGPHSTQVAEALSRCLPEASRMHAVRRGRDRKRDNELAAASGLDRSHLLCRSRAFFSTPALAGAFPARSRTISSDERAFS